MELLSEIWDKTTDAMTAFSEGVSEGLIRLFGNSNERQIRRMRADRRPGSTSWSRRCRPSPTRSCAPRPTSSAAGSRQGETLDDLLPEAFAACREAGRRFLKMRHYDVQLMGGMVLHGGNIAEMVTGEGKTLVATLAAYLNALEGQGRPRRHGQRLPRPPRRRVDEPALQRPGHDRRRDPVGHGLARSARRSTPATSPTAPTTSSASTTSATT